MESKCLFKHDGQCIRESDFRVALRALGIRPGQTLLVHAGLRAFGVLGGNWSRGELCRPLIHAMRQSVGTRGTIIMPTFTYAFCRGTPYNRKKSPSEVGVLSEFFRTERGVVRSMHPIFSVAAYGAKSRELTDVREDSFGQDSFFAKFLKAKGTILFFGSATFFNSCTFIHHIEQMHHVPYRFIKTFHGKSINGRKSSSTRATYFVRPLDGSVENDNSRLEKILRRKKMLKEITIGASSITAVRAQDVFREGMHLLDKNSYVLLRKPS